MRSFDHSCRPQARQVGKITQHADAAARRQDAILLSLWDACGCRRLRRVPGSRRNPHKGNRCRPDGDRVVTTLDENGFLLRHSRILPDGREIIIIDNRSRGPGRGYSREAAAPYDPHAARPLHRRDRDRYRREGSARLQDRLSRPHRLRQPTPQTVIEEIEQLRRQESLNCFGRLGNRPNESDH
jgi:hypothetical protein